MCTDSRIVVLWITIASAVIAVRSGRIGTLKLPRRLRVNGEPYKFAKFPLIASSSLPVRDLIEVVDEHLDPQSEDMKIDVMQNFIGKKFNHRYMSVERPKESYRHPNGTLNYNSRRRRPSGKMPAEIRSFDFSKAIQFTSGKGTKTNRIGNKLKRKFQRFLWTFTFCPVKYVWKDLGVRFWPRWIKKGTCHSGKRSCSIPAGMRCRPKTPTRLTLLRWHCKNYKSQEQNCNWIKVVYPIITECRCSC